TVNNAADGTPPTVAILNPSGGLVQGTVTPWAITADNIGVVGVQFKLNGANLGGEVTTTPYRINWSTTSVPDGTYTLTAVARDATGNLTTSSPVSVTVDNTLPVVTGKTPASGATVQTTAPALTATFSEAVQPGTITFTLKDQAGVSLPGVVTYDTLIN